MTPLTALQSDAIRDAIALDVETNPTLAAILRDLGRTLPTQGIETTWSKMGALQQQAEPVVAQAAMGGTPSPYPRNAGSTGAIILSGLTAQTPCLAAGTRDKSDGCPVAGLMGGN